MGYVQEAYNGFLGKADAIWQAIAAKCTWLTPGKYTEAMVLAGNVLYVGGEDEVAAFDAAAGKKLWSEKTGSRVRGLAVANGRLYVSTISGQVICYAAAKGEGREPRKGAAAEERCPIHSG